jgi:hypothetical protein
LWLEKEEPVIGQNTIGAEAQFAQGSSTLNTNWNIAEILTLLIFVLGIIASVCGLLMPNLYRDPVSIAPALRGQDLITLLTMPVLLVTLFAVRRGSTRARLIWIGLLGYVLYAYLGAALGYFLNSFTLLYIALFSLSLTAMVSAIANLKLSDLETKFDAGIPRWPVIAFLMLMAVMLGAREILDNIGFIRSGLIPSGMQLSGGTNYFVYTFDLGLIVPLSVLSSICLWRRSPFGLVSSGMVLIKSAVMGLALLVMNGFNANAGGATDGLLGLWAFIAIGGLGLSVWFYGHCTD